MVKHLAMISIIVLAISGNGFAGSIYKCVDTAGNVSYSQTACPENTNGSEFGDSAQSKQRNSNPRQYRTTSSSNYFYCGFSNDDGTGQDYAKWGKGTDFKFNQARNRWEWISKYSNQYIYSDGRYRQISKLPGVRNQSGTCNSAMERIYKQKMSGLINQYRK